MNAPRVDHFVGFSPLGGTRVSFRTAGCGSCAWSREFQGREAVAALRSYAALLRQRALEAEELARRIEALEELKRAPAH